MNMGSNERGEKAWTNGVGPMLKLPLVKEKIEFEKTRFFFFDQVSWGDDWSRKVFGDWLPGT